MGGKSKWGVDRYGRPKTKKQPYKHSCPSTSGIQNLPKSYIKRVSGTGGGMMKDILEIKVKGMENREDYKGKWTDKDLEKEVHEFFEFCAERDIKPAKAGIRLWLGVSESQYWEWETNTSIHPLKSKVLQEASEFMQMQYIGKIESHPTGNIFLLKSGHGYSDKQEIQVTGDSVDSDDISDAIKRLGLEED